MSPDKRRTKREDKPSASDNPAVRESDPGPPYVVRWHPGARAELDASWPNAEKVAMLHAVEKLEALGPQLPFPHSSAVQGGAKSRLRELRPRAGHSRWRPLYRRVNPGVFVVFAVAPEAKIDPAGFNAAVVRAIDRLGELKPD